MKKLMFVVVALFSSACGEEPLFTACGLEVHDELVTEEMACNAVESVRLAFAEWGEEVHPVSVLGGISVYRRNIKDEDTYGEYIFGYATQDRIIVDIGQVEERGIYRALVHEIIHVVQNNELELSFREMNQHGCPYYGPDCNGMLSIESIAHKIALGEYAPLMD